MKAWLSDLVDEYPTTTKDGKPIRTQAAIVRLARIYSQYDDDVMQAAVDEYMLHEEWFPRISSLRPYVKRAVEDARSVNMPPADNAGLNEVRMAKLRTQLEYSDDFILAWEIERGTMTGDIEAPEDDWRALFIDATMPVAEAVL
jgi:hypothetical protein